MTPSPLHECSRELSSLPFQDRGCRDPSWEPTGPEQLRAKPKWGETDLSDRMGMLKSCSWQSGGFEAEAAAGGARGEAAAPGLCRAPLQLRGGTHGGAEAVTSRHIYRQPPACWGGPAGEEQSLDAATWGHGSSHCDRAAGHAAVPSHAAWGEGTGGGRSRRTFLSMPHVSVSVCRIAPWFILELQSGRVLP